MKLSLLSCYLDWIDTQMRSRCEDGSRAWCSFPGIIPPPIPMSDAELLDDLKLVGCAATGRGGSWTVLVAGLLLVWTRRVSRRPTAP